MQLNFDKHNGLIPIIIQDNQSLQVLMLGYMNKEAYHKTVAENRVTFYSRSKKRLWTKGEESGNFLTVNEMSIDCDQDTILIKATPAGPTCHKGTTSCFGDRAAKGFLYKLEETISERIDTDEATFNIKYCWISSYTIKLHTIFCLIEIKIQSIIFIFFIYRYIVVIY